MQRKGWIVAAGALLLIGVGLYFAGGSDTPPAGAVPHVPAPTEGPSGVDVTGDRGGPGGATTGSRRSAGADGGVAVARIAPRVDDPDAPRTGPTGVPTSRGLPRADPDENRSSGWRLGQARRRVAILEGRVDLYQSAVDRLVAEGRNDVAERQRAVIERVRGRITDFRAQEAELLEQAEADGTMNDVDQGYEEGEQENRQPVVGGGVAPR